jgi:hypothetical protein
MRFNSAFKGLNGAYLCIGAYIDLFIPAVPHILAQKMFLQLVLSWPPLVHINTPNATIVIVHTLQLQDSF